MVSDRLSFNLGMTPLTLVSPTVSHHIKEFYRPGLVRKQPKGQNMERWIDPEVLKGLARFFPSRVFNQNISGNVLVKANLFFSGLNLRVTHSERLESPPGNPLDNLLCLTAIRADRPRRI